jgi:CHAT domain-containing protein
MSLWEVDDEATQVLMTAFYQNLLSGHSKYESLKLAQNKVRQGQFMHNGKSVSGSDPHFWAAFVLVD